MIFLDQGSTSLQFHNQITRLNFDKKPFRQNWIWINAFLVSFTLECTPKVCSKTNVEKARYSFVCSDESWGALHLGLIMVLLSQLLWRIYVRIHLRTSLLEWKTLANNKMIFQQTSRSYENHQVSTQGWTSFSNNTTSISNSSFYQISSRRLINF